MDGGAGVWVARTIATRRLLLRPLLPAHAEEMAGVLAGPSLYAFTGGSPPSVTSLRARYQRLADGCSSPGVHWCNWVLEDRSQHRLSGTVQATVVRTPGGWGAEVAWIIGEAWQSRGYATEAARGLLEWLTSPPREVSEVSAHIHPAHGASAGVAAALGMRRTGELVGDEVEWRVEARSRQVPSTDS